jgi:hypothetical protein
MSRRKTTTQVICREVLQEVIEWRKKSNPDEDTLKKGIKILLLRRLKGVYSVDEGQIYGLIGGILSMLRAYYRKEAMQLGMLPPLSSPLESITGFMRPIEESVSENTLLPFMRPAIQPPNVDLALYDEDATAKMRASLLKDMEEIPEGMESNEIDFLSGLSGSNEAESASEETESISPSSPTKENAA